MDEVKRRGLENETQQRIFSEHQIFSLSQSHSMPSLYNWYKGGRLLDLGKLAPVLVRVMGTFLPR